MIPAAGVPMLPVSDVEALLGDSCADVPILGAHAVHLWAWPLLAGNALVRLAHAVLNAEEQARAARFLQPVHRDRFALGHGVMRHLLGRYQGLPPGAIEFTRTVGGKPQLAAGAGAAPLHFNLTHSADRAVLAIARQPVGVDLEHARPRLDALGMAARYFFGAEHEAIRTAEASERGVVFLRYWVAKEAVLKAQGVGLAFPLDAFEVTFQADGASARVASQDPSRLCPHWTVRMLALGAQWPMAVAAMGDAWTMVPCTARPGPVK